MTAGVSLPEEERRNRRAPRARRGGIGEIARSISPSVHSARRFCSAQLCFTSHERARLVESRREHCESRRALPEVG